VKKIIVFICIITVLAVSSVCYADTPIKKLGRGIANMGTCILEVPKCISDANTESGPIAAMTFGLLEGVYSSCVRLLVGMYETVTFLVPVPEDYGPILTNPEFFLNEGLF